MDAKLKKLLPFTKPYQSHITWNVIYNIYALFSTISMLTLLILQVLLKKKKSIAQPVRNRKY
jgi:subfamily B ATP-binding cassette protein MsbA